MLQDVEQLWNGPATWVYLFGTRYFKASQSSISRLIFRFYLNLLLTIFIASYFRKALFSSILFSYSTGFYDDVSKTSDMAFSVESKLNDKD